MLSYLVRVLIFYFCTQKKFLFSEHFLFEILIFCFLSNATDFAEVLEIFKHILVRLGNVLNLFIPTLLPLFLTSMISYLRKINDQLNQIKNKLKA